MDTLNVFVYGSLRRGHRMHDNFGLDRCASLGQQHVWGRLYSLGPYPGVKLADTINGMEPLTRIVGEVYTLENVEQLKALDMYEGEGALYRRRLITTTEGTLVWVYEYIKTIPEKNYIPEADWFARTGQTAAAA